MFLTLYIHFDRAYFSRWSEKTQTYVTTCIFQVPISTYLIIASQVESKWFLLKPSVPVTIGDHIKTT